ncbi:MAG: hypothetical protein ACTS4X_01405 [Candidatus Hodgkinia cicadicola]
MNGGSPLNEIAKHSERSVLLSLFNRHLAFAWAWLSGIDVIERTMFVDGTLSVLRSALAKGGVIFTDSQPFQHLLDVNAHKHKVIGIARVLQLRSKTPCGPFNDVLAKVAAVLDPSSCLLALGTWQLPISLAINALRSNAIPVAATVLSPLHSVPSAVWEDWVAAIAASPARPFFAILQPLVGLEVISVLLDVLRYWKRPRTVPSTELAKPTVS